MAKASYIGIDGTARNSLSIFVGVDNIAHEVKKMYIGDERGVARLCWSDGAENTTFDERLIQFIQGELHDLTAADFGNATTLNCGWTFATGAIDEDGETVIAHSIEIPDTVNDLSKFDDFPNPNDFISGDWGGVSNVLQQLYSNASLFFTDKNLTVKFSKNLLDLGGLYSAFYNGNCVVDFSGNDAIPSIDLSASGFANCTIRVPADLLDAWKTKWRSYVRSDEECAPTYVGV